MLSEKRNHDFGESAVFNLVAADGCGEVHFIQAHNSAVIRGVAKKRERRCPPGGFEPPNRRNQRAFQSQPSFGLKKNCGVC